MTMRVLPLLLAAPLLAHDTYLLPQKFRVQPGETILISIHNGDSFPNSEEAVEVARLRDARTSQGAELRDARQLGRATHGFVTLERAGSVWVSVRTQPRAFELPAAKWEAYLKEEGLDEALAWRAANQESGKAGRERYGKYAKTLLTCGASDEAWRYPLGLPIEFVPERDPSLVKPGERLPVRVLLRGKPAAGLQVEAAWSAYARVGSTVVGRTDAQGRIEIPIHQSGRWRLHAVAIERLEERREADWESLWASMTFESQ